MQWKLGTKLLAKVYKDEKIKDVQAGYSSEMDAVKQTVQMHMCVRNLAKQFKALSNINISYDKVP